MGLPTLQDRRERGDLIILYKIVNVIEKLDNQNQVMMEEETTQMRGHSRKIKNGWCLKYTRKYSFPHRIVDTWNGLKEEVVEATSIHKLKEMLDIWRSWRHYEPHSNPVQYNYVGKYTHTHVCVCVYIYIY